MTLNEFLEPTGKSVGKSFNMFPPFYSDCGKNITIGKSVFINSGCRFQDQGGIIIGDGALMCHNVVQLATTQSLQLEPLLPRMCWRTLLSAAFRR